MKWTTAIAALATCTAGAWGQQPQSRSAVKQSAAAQQRSVVIVVPGLPLLVVPPAAVREQLQRGLALTAHNIVTGDRPRPTVVVRSYPPIPVQASAPAPRFGYGPSVFPGSHFDNDPFPTIHSRLHSRLGGMHSFANPSFHHSALDHLHLHGIPSALDDFHTGGIGSRIHQFGMPSIGSHLHGLHGPRFGSAAWQHDHFGMPTFGSSLHQRLTPPSFGLPAHMGGTSFHHGGLHAPIVIPRGGGLPPIVIP
jgi:hypothetical protein